MKTVTIITSAYNAERTIERTISSIRNQTYPYFEYLLINHGSTDQTGELIAESCAADARLKAITIKENTGFIGKALNIGLRQASGEYICFLDADDIYEKDFLEIMLDNMMQNECDVGICGYSYFSEKENKVFFTFSQQNSLISTYEEYQRFFREEFDKSDCFTNIDFYWNKCYRREYLKKHDCFFRETSLLIADAFFNMELLKTNPKVAFLSNSGVLHILGDQCASASWKRGLTDEYLEYIQMWESYLMGFLPEKNVLDLVRRRMGVLYVFPRLVEGELSCEDMIRELERWVCDGKGIYQKLLKLEGYNRVYLNLIEQVMMKIKMKYHGLKVFEDSEDNVVIEYGKQYLLEENMEERLQEIFQLIWRKENIFSLGAQELADILV